MDFQETKRPLMESLIICQESLNVAHEFVLHLKPNLDRLVAACTPDLFATDGAYELVSQGTAFRDAYQTMAQQPESFLPGDLVQRLRQRTSLGASGRLELALMRSRSRKHRVRWDVRVRKFQSSIAALLGDNSTVPNQVNVENRQSEARDLANIVNEFVPTDAGLVGI